MDMTNPMTSDEALVKAFQAGEPSAFAELVRRYQDQVYSSCFRWIRDPVIAEEVSQDVFVAVYRSLSQFRGDAQFSTWLFRVVINHCKNRRLYRSRRATDRHDSIHDTEHTKPELVAFGVDTSSNAIARQAAVHIHTALAELDEDSRAIIHLRDLSDRSYEEIAEIMEIPRGTVKSRLHRARNHLARVLKRTLSVEDVF